MYIVSFKFCMQKITRSCGRNWLKNRGSNRAREGRDSASSLFCSGQNSSGGIRRWNLGGVVPSPTCVLILAMVKLESYLIYWGYFRPFSP